MSILTAVMRSAFEGKDEKLFAGALQEFKTRFATQPVIHYEDQLKQLRKNK